ncbi:hypothetical protein H4R21_004192 [Coemansia helicoidea]|uniref:Uncharacterized protein n=1 Tax=Coemansia helicoidea TaxID=1286919 RepID=A0ACC1KZS4_9FUNG|nr:hypothetical protein H4R21_004192 [Coemansia helicoidea]
MGKEAANIWCAASDGDLDRVRALVEGDKAAVNRGDENGYTPLHAAASWKHRHVLQFLLDNGGDVGVVDADGDTPLHTCEDRECAELLLEHGADANKENHEGLTPVLTTLENEATEVTELLCKRLGIPVPTPTEAGEADQMDAAGQDAAGQDAAGQDAAEKSKIMDLSNWIMEQADQLPGTESELKDMVTRYVLSRLRNSTNEPRDDTVAATIASSMDRQSQDDDPPADEKVESSG